MSQSEVIQQRAVFLLTSRGKGRERGRGGGEEGEGEGEGGGRGGERTGVFLRGKLYAERING